VRSTWQGHEGSQVEQSDEVLGAVYAVLAHQVRREILRIVGGYLKPIPFSEIASFLNVRPGTFYFHIKKMEGFIEQTEDRNYVLTDGGYLALRLLESGEDQLNLPPESREEAVPALQKERESILGKILLSSVFREIAPTKRTVFEVIIMILVLTALAEVAHLGILPLFYSSALYFGPLASAVCEISGIIMMWLILETVTSLLQNRRIPRRNELSIELFLAMPLCLLPLGLFPACVIAFGLVNIPLLSLFPVGATLLQLLLQLLSGLLIAQATKTCKPVSFERALVPVLAIMYISATASFVVGLSFPA